VGCSMKDHLRMVLAEDRLETRLVTHIGNDRFDQQRGEIFLKVKNSFKDAVLAMPHQNQHGWAPACYLAAKFTSDRATAARDQHNSPVKGLPHQLFFKLSGLAAEQVSNVHFAQTIDADFATQEFVDARDGAEWDPATTASIGNQTHHAPGRRRNGNDHLIHAPALKRFGKIFQGANDGNAVNLLAQLGGVIIEEADRFQVELRVFLKFADHQRASIASANNQDTAGLTLTSSLSPGNTFRPEAN